jgi:hypothetical protein
MTLTVTTKLDSRVLDPRSGIDISTYVSVSLFVKCLVLVESIPISDFSDFRISGIE